MPAPARHIASSDRNHPLLPLDSRHQWTGFMARTGLAGCRAQDWLALGLFAEQTALPALSPA